MSEFYRTSEVAEMFGVTSQCLSLWRKRGEGPPFLQLGPRSFRYRKATVDDYLAALERGEDPSGRRVTKSGKLDRRKGTPSYATRLARGEELEDLPAFRGKCRGAE